MEVSAIGISHHTAPLAVREQLALSADQARELLRAIHADDVFEEALVLSTCNRTEVYFVCRNAADPLDYLLGLLGRINALPVDLEQSMFYRHDGAEAVRHLFRVAAALDSQIVGEHQIIAQVKLAYRMALEERTARFLLNKLLHFSFRVSKAVRTETELGRGSVSVAEAAVDLAGEVMGALAGKTVLLVGAGQTAALAARALMRRDVGRIVVASRTIARAKEAAARLLQLADEDNGTRRRGAAPQSKQRPQTQAIDLAAIPEVIGEADLVICSTSSPDFVLTRKRFAGAIGRSPRPICIVDIAVPRDVEPALGELPNVHLHNIDDLDRMVADNIQRRRGEIPKAEAIVDEGVRDFARWFDSLQIVPTIKLLRRRFRDFEQAELRRHAGRFADGNRDQLEQYTRRLCNQIVHRPIAFLREMSTDSRVSDQLAAAEMVRKVFDLDALEQDE